MSVMIISKNQYIIPKRYQCVIPRFSQLYSYGKLELELNLREVLPLVAGLSVILHQF